MIFSKGRVMLVRAAAEREGVSYKRMYLAFQNRWKLFKQKNVCIHYRRPPHCSLPTPEIESIVSAKDDVNALAFIVRVADDYDACGLMEWGPATERGDRLIMDSDYWEDDGRDFCFPLLDVSSWPEEGRKGIIAACRLTLHAVDVQRYQVVTIMEDSPPHDYEFGEVGQVLKTHCHGMGSTNGSPPDLYGVPPPGSPCYRPLDTRIYMEDLEDTTIENFQVSGSLTLGYDFESEEEASLYADGPDGVRFDFGHFNGSLVRRYEICNYFRALMNDKCVYGGVPYIPPVTISIVRKQPAWVENEKILDTVISFAPFESQASDLRAVCRQFKDSAMRQLETKLLDRTKVIGFDRCGPAGWFKTEVFRGWSDDQFATTKDSVIDEAFWLASCRCLQCKGKDICPGTKKPLTFGRKETVLDLDQARNLLNGKGWIKLTSKFPDNQGDGLWELERNAEQRLKISFKQAEMTNFDLCNKVFEIIEGKVWYGLMPDTFRRSYGLSGEMTSRQFLRSLFLVFCNKAISKITDDDGESKKKEGRLSYPSIGIAESMVDSSEGNRYYRMKGLVRFYTSCDEPIEIRIESRSVIS